MYTLVQCRNQLLGSGIVEVFKLAYDPNVFVLFHLSDVFVTVL